MNDTLAPTARAKWLTPAFVQQLREVTKENRAHLDLPAFRDGLQPEYYREHRTVMIGSDRQSGKSQCIVELAERNSWIFVVNLRMRDDMQERLRSAGKTVIAERVFTSGDLMNFTFAHGEKEPGILDKDIETYGKPKTIFVDDASYFFERFGRKEFYKQLFPRLLSESDFVLLG